MGSTRRHIVIDARVRRDTGVGRYIDRLVEHLQDIDDYHRYTVLVNPEDSWRPKAKNFKALPCPYPQFSLNPLHQLGFAWQLYRLKPDLVHFGMTQQPLLYFGNIVATTHDTTMYYFVRPKNTSMPMYRVRMQLYKFLVWWSHRKSKRIIMPTRTTVDEFVQRQPFVKNKAVVTYEASEPEFAARAEKPAGINGDFILYVGTAFPHKNLFKMVRGLEELNKKYPRLKLVITGKREEKHHAELIEWVQKRPSAGNVIFPGYVSDGELKWLYENCRAYVFTSLSEGFGLPPLEAMTHGAPVVSSNASVMPEVYGDAAHYFDAKRPKDMAAKVTEVLENADLRKKLIKNGRQQIKKYSWRKMAEETLTVYKAVLEE